MRTYILISLCLLSACAIAVDPELDEQPDAISIQVPIDVIAAPTTDPIANQQRTDFLACCERSADLTLEECTVIWNTQDTYVYNQAECAWRER